MKVHMFAEFSKRKSTTLDMPTRTPRAPRGFPGRFVSSRRLPENKVKRISFLRIVDIAATQSRQSQHFLLWVATDCAERIERTHIEIDRISADVCMRLVEDRLDEFADVRNG